MKELKCFENLLRGNFDIFIFHLITFDCSVFQNIVINYFRFCNDAVAQLKCQGPSPKREEEAANNF